MITDKIGFVQENLTETMSRVSFAFTGDRLSHTDYTMSDRCYLMMSSKVTIDRYCEWPHYEIQEVDFPLHIGKKEMLDILKGRV